MDQLIRSVRYIESNPNWQEQHTLFLNDLFINANNTFKEILKEPNGSKKIRKIKGWSKKNKFWFEKKTTQKSK